MALCFTTQYLYSLLMKTQQFEERLSFFRSQLSRLQPPVKVFFQFFFLFFAHYWIEVAVRDRSLSASMFSCLAFPLPVLPGSHLRWELDFSKILRFLIS